MAFARHGGTSSGSRMPPSKDGQRQMSERMKGCFSLHCNKCRILIEAVSFVCACNCLLCDSCTEEHFCRDSRCPICRRNLQEDEFFDVLVTDQTATADKDDREKFQALFTKQRAEVPALTFQDACATLMWEGDSIVNNTQLFMTQFVRELDEKIRKGEESEERAVTYKQQNNELKQDFQKKTQEHQEIINFHEGRHKKQISRIRDLQIQLEQVSNSRPMVSASTAGSSSRNHPIDDNTQQSLPFVRRMHNKEKEDLAKERNLHQQKRPILGRSRESRESSSSHVYNSGRPGRYQPYPTHYNHSRS